MSVDPHNGCDALQEVPPANDPMVFILYFVCLLQLLLREATTGAS